MCEWNGPLLLLPEQNVPEQQPAGVDQEGHQRVDQGAVQAAVQDALRDDGQEEHPALHEADGRLLKLLEAEHAEEQRAGGAEHHHDEGRQSPAETTVIIHYQRRFSATAQPLKG